MTPQQFLAQRICALQQQDYAAVYASYHPEAPFLQMFPSLDSYRCFAGQQLTDVRLADWKILRQRQLAAGRIELILQLELLVDTTIETLYELALLMNLSRGWRYHSAQKLNPDDYSGVPESLDFCHFEQASPKIRY